MHRFLTPLLILLTVLLGANYLTWRWLESLDRSAWWIAVPLLLAITCGVIELGLVGLAVRRWRIRQRAEGRPRDAAEDASGHGADSGSTAALAPHDVRIALARARSALRKARRAPEAADPVVAGMLDDVDAAIRRARADVRAGAPLTELAGRLQREVDAAARRAVTQNFDEIQADLAVIAALDLPAEDQMVWPEELASAVERMSRHDLSPLVSIEPVRELLDSVALDRPPDAR